MPTPRVTPATRDAQIRACHAAGLTTNTAVGAVLGIHPNTVGYWRAKLNIPKPNVFKGHWEERHGPGSYAALVALVEAGVASPVIQARYHVTRQYVGVLRQAVRKAQRQAADEAEPSTRPMPDMAGTRTYDTHERDTP